MTPLNGISTKFDCGDKALIALKSVLEENDSQDQAEELLLSYRPEAPKYIVQFCDTGILRRGYICTVVGAQGTGKSNITEAIVSSFLNPCIDSLSFKVDTDGPVLWMDGERTKDDIFLGFNRIKKRISIETNPGLVSNNRFKNVHCYPLVTYPSRGFRIKELERLCESIRPTLVILDGAADFVYDTLDTKECVSFLSILTALANKYGFGVILSIHPNPDVKADHKPRGFLGSELIRVSESMILLKRAPDDRDLRVLTTGFTHGKNRGGNDCLSHYFRWSTQDNMFMSCEYSPTIKLAKAEEISVAFEEVLADKNLSYSGLIAALISKNKCSNDSTAEKWIKRASTSKIIFKRNGLYGLGPY